MSFIFLIGLPGAGKSTVGKKISKHLKYSFIDLDQFIEKKENCSISNLFLIQGEEYFREVEKNCLLEILSLKENILVSTGGGTPCFFNNLDLMLQKGIVIYLNPPIGMIAQRVAEGKKKRPFFKGLSSKETESKVRELLAARESYYKKAHVAFNQEFQALGEFIKEIELLIK